MCWRWCGYVRSAQRRNNGYEQLEGKFESEIYRLLSGSCAARPTSTWMGVNARPALTAMGWRFILIYVGHQANRPDHQGMFTRIYFDVEQGGVLSSEYVLYVTNWCGYLKNLSSYIPSVYCSYSDTADQFKNMVNGMGGRIYCYRIGTYTGNSGVDPAPNPANCSVAYASTWQLEQLAKLLEIILWW